MYEIDNVLRPYAWGSTTAIAGLAGPAGLGRARSRTVDRSPPGLPLHGLHTLSQTAPRRAEPLDALIAADPEHFWGPASVAEFGPRLPFLLKFLAAESPLSLQVHPTLDQARAGFARENAAGVDPPLPQTQLQGRQPQAGDDLCPDPVRGAVRVPARRGVTRSP